MRKNTPTPKERQNADHRAWQRMLRETRNIENPAAVKALGLDRDLPHVSAYLAALARYRVAIVTGMPDVEARMMKLRAEAAYHRAILPEEIDDELTKRSQT